MTGEVKLEALKPCPFCGGTKLNYVPGQFVACMNISCGGQIDMGAPWGGPKEDGVAFIIAAWNTRPALSEDKAGAVQGGWRPIESAPKDGTPIDVWRPEGGRDTVFWGYPSHECGEAGRYCDSDWHSIRAPGWVCNTFDELVGRKHAPFTHWMPLPASPGARP